MAQNTNLFFSRVVEKLHSPLPYHETFHFFMQSETKLHRSCLLDTSANLEPVDSSPVFQSFCFSGEWWINYRRVKYYFHKYFK